MTMQERLEAIERRYDELDSLMADPEIAVDFTRVQTLAKEQGSIRTIVELSREFRDAQTQLDEVRLLLREESDADMIGLAREEEADLLANIERIEADLRIELIPKDPNDEKNVILEIRAGTGGDEAGLFASDLYRMYTRYAQRNGWRTEVIDINQTGLGAIKEIVFELKGNGAYSRLKHESGGHRVQRVPVTESSGRIHTSAATVAVLPEAEEGGHQHQARRLGHRHFPRGRTRRAECAEGRDRCPHNPCADGYSSHMPRRTLAAQEPREGDGGLAL